MKTTKKTKQGLITGLIVLLSLTFSSINAHGLSIDPIKKEKPSKPCLIVKGKFIKSTKSSANTYTLALIQENTVVETKLVQSGSSFQFKIGKGNWWAIKIIGDGCVPKIYSINTNLPQDADEDMIYSLSFVASEPISEFESSQMDSEVLDFPIAIFQFDTKLETFYYNEEYTANIMKTLLKNIN